MRDAGSRDYTLFLWLLKLGTLANLYFLANTAGADARVVVPARIFFAVSAYRCLFPVRYEGNVVLHDSPLSSVFATRLLATFSEVAYIFLFSHVLRVLNTGHAAGVDALSWLMVAQVVISQGLVWAAILTGRRALYFWEELGWLLIFAANTAASTYLYFAVGATGDRALLLLLNLLFGALYLPWQLMHLRMLRAAARGDEAKPLTLAAGLARAIRARNRRTDAAAWGGLVGLSWMTGYWATLVPAWLYVIVRVLA